MKKCYLYLEKGPLQQAIYPLIGTTTIGRGPDNIICLTDPTVSRNHARLSFQEGKWVIEDLGSANGIIFGGRRVNQVSLQSGDAFHIGAITFRFQDSEAYEERGQLFETVEILMASVQEKDLLAESSRDEKWGERLHNAITAIPFFMCLEETDCRELVNTSTVHIFHAGEMIIREGDPGRSIYVILSGRVKVFTRDHHGKELELAVLGESQFFGEMSFMTGKPRSKSVSALDTTMVIEFSYTSMKRLIEQQPAIKETLSKYFYERVKDTEEKTTAAGVVERRRDPRLSDQVTVNLEVPSRAATEGKTSSRSWEGTSIDLSVSGIVVKVTGGKPEAFHPDTQVHLTIELPPPWGQVRTLGIVQRVEPEETQEKILFVGIEFAGVSAADAEKLREFIQGEVI
jgi:CRP-like cAMP-binding protein